MTFMFNSIRLPEHTCPNYNNVHVPEHPITRPSERKPLNVCVTGASMFQKHGAQWDEVYVLPRNPDAKTPRVMGQKARHMRTEKRLTISAVLHLLHAFRPVIHSTHFLRVRGNTSNWHCAKTIGLHFAIPKMCKILIFNQGCARNFTRKFRGAMTFRFSNAQYRSS